MQDVASEAQGEPVVACSMPAQQHRGLIAYKLITTFWQFVHQLPATEMVSKQTREVPVPEGDHISTQGRFAWPSRQLPDCGNSVLRGPVYLFDKRYRPFGLSRGLLLGIHDPPAFSRAGRPTGDHRAGGADDLQPACAGATRNPAMFGSYPASPITRRASSKSRSAYTWVTSAAA